MPENVFEQGQQATETNLTIEPKETDTIIEELKERGIDELAKGKAHADQFIEHLKEQNAQLKDELDKRLTAESALEEIKTARQETKVSNEPTGSGLNPEDVRSLVQESITEANKAQIAVDNINLVSAEVTKVYGEKGPEFIAGKAAELNITVEELMKMAERSPKAFLTVAGIGGDKSVEPTGVTQSTVNQDVLNDTTSQTTQGNAKYYYDLRKANPSKFYTPAIQQQLFKDRKRLGQDYYK